LNIDEVMKVCRLGNCEIFVGKRAELVFDTFIDLSQWGEVGWE